METCCDALIENDFVDENVEAKIKARIKQYVVVGIVGSLFGFAICGAVILMVKYLIDKHKDTSNFNAMRRQSRARSISDETKDRRRITLATMSSFDSTTKRISNPSIFTN
ncbi:unnamed protein product [Oikopleura dioica]|uniref:Uncharacterized protein n=1 Tax=Oikopleura dioica TaxID=34765 RepID=E4XW51_OIKDI|nr:unnamed protein product [Oikopleura dioica]